MFCIGGGVFSEVIFNSPGSDLYSLLASSGDPGTVEKVYFKVVADNTTMMPMVVLMVAPEMKVQFTVLMVIICTQFDYEAALLILCLGLVFL